MPSLTSATRSAATGDRYRRESNSGAMAEELGRQIALQARALADADAGRIERRVVRVFPWKSFHSGSKKLMATWDSRKRTLGGQKSAEFSAPLNCLFEDGWIIDPDTTRFLRESLGSKDNDNHKYTALIRKKPAAA